MRVRLRGLNRVRKRLADGRFVTYYYAWKGGPALPGGPGSPEFVDAYNKAIAQRAQPPQGVLLGILQAYQASPDFQDLAPSTRRSYVPLIKRIEKAFADFPLTALTDRRTRGVFMAWRDRSLSIQGADRRIMLGPSSLAFSRGVLIGGSLRRTRASAAAGYIAHLDPIRYGPMPTRRLFWQRPRDIYTWP